MCTGQQLDASLCVHDPVVRADAASVHGVDVGRYRKLVTTSIALTGFIIHFMADVQHDVEITDPEELVFMGIRVFAIGNFQSAAGAFGKATELMAQEHGDEHDSLGEVYLHYARALLEVSREEAEPLGDAIPRGDSDSDSDDETENATISSESKDESSEKKDESTDPEGKDTDTEKQDDEKEIENKDDTETKENDEVKQNGSTELEKTDHSEKKDDEKLDTIKEETAETNGITKETSQEDDDEESQKKEDCTDLQLAWEVLEVAKKIFTNRGETGKERLAETMILLGEVAMESENFADGVNDMKVGLELQKSLFEPTSRKLAESYYKLGIVQATLSDIDEAIGNFELAIDTLKQRIKMLKDQLEEKKTEKTNEIKEEIEEMGKLIPEIEEKISDMKSIKEEVTSQFIMEMVNKMPKEAPSKDGAGTSSSKTATDITHLVKRKRKADEEPADSTEIQPAKKPTP
ncbi:uncharacterized protein CBL_09431 [Carabus blaptoides fortunei]